MMDRRDIGWLLAGSRVRLADGQAQRIEALRPGDLLRCANGQPAELVELLPGPRGHRVLEIGLSDGMELTLTPGWPLVVARPGRLAVLPAAELSVRDGLAVYADGELRRGLVTVIRSRLWGGAVLAPRLRCSGLQAEHLLLVNDVAVGDLHLAERVAALATASRLKRVG